MPWTVVLLILMQSGLSPLTWGDEPVKVTSKEGKFEIVFPKKPETQTREKALIWMVEDGEKGIYFLSLKKHPVKIDATDKADIRNRFDGGQDSIVRMLRGKLLKSVDGTLDDKKTLCRDLDISIPGKGIYRVRYVSTNEHFYQVMVGGSKDWVDAAPAVEFIKSFKVVEEK
ncbi:MAG: hypothetical protein QM703_16305 [Gemmatales bacterium]